jgi:hypothetical protein
MGNKNMNAEEIDLTKGICLHPAHTPPEEIFTKPGIYEYECPGCKKKTLIEYRPKR